MSFKDFSLGAHRGSTSWKCKTIGKETESLVKNGCRETCLDKSLLRCKNVCDILDFKSW